jgi:hypothetical protein
LKGPLPGRGTARFETKMSGQETSEEGTWKSISEEGEKLEIEVTGGKDKVAQELEVEFRGNDAMQATNPMKSDEKLRFKRAS